MFSYLFTSSWPSTKLPCYQKLKLQVIPPLSELYVALPNIPIPAYRNILIEVAKLPNVLFTILYYIRS